MAERKRHISRLGLVGGIMIGVGLIGMGDCYHSNRYYENTVSQVYPELPPDIVAHARATRSSIGKTAEMYATMDALFHKDRSTIQNEWKTLGEYYASSQEVSNELIIAEKADDREMLLQNLRGSEKFLGTDVSRLMADVVGGITIFFTGIMIIGIRITDPNRIRIP